MSVVLLIPGADGRAWYWHRLVPRLAALGHEPVTVDLPEDRSAMLADYARTAVDALGGRGAQVVVAQSIGRHPDAGFDIAADFFHDVPADVTAEALAAPVSSPSDRFFPVDFQRRVARDRLGIDIQEIPGGHLNALSRAPGGVGLLSRCWRTGPGGRWTAPGRTPASPTGRTGRRTRRPGPPGRRRSAACSPNPTPGSAT